MDCQHFLQKCTHDSLYLRCVGFWHRATSVPQQVQVVVIKAFLARCTIQSDLHGSGPKPSLHHWIAPQPLHWSVVEGSLARSSWIIFLSAFITNSAICIQQSFRRSIGHNGSQQRDHYLLDAIAHEVQVLCHRYHNRRWFPSSPHFVDKIIIHFKYPKRRLTQLTQRATRTSNQPTSNAGQRMLKHAMTIICRQSVCQLKHT